MTIGTAVQQLPAKLGRMSRLAALFLGRPGGAGCFDFAGGEFGSGCHTGGCGLVGGGE